MKGAGRRWHGGGHLRGAPCATCTHPIASSCCSLRAWHPSNFPSLSPCCVAEGFAVKPQKASSLNLSPPASLPDRTLRFCPEPAWGDAAGGTRLSCPQPFSLRAFSRASKGSELLVTKVRAPTFNEPPVGEPGLGEPERRPAEPRQRLTTGTAAWKRWAKALLTTGGHFFNNAVQSNFILSVPFMPPAPELLSGSGAKGGGKKCYYYYFFF